MRTMWRRALGGLLGMAIVTTAAAPARASDGLTTFVTTVILAVVIPDVVFATYDIAVAGKGELPSAGWSIAETIITAPQTVLGNSFYATVQSDQYSEAPIQLLTMIPSIGVTILSTHGIWSTATTNVRPGVLAGSSVAVGANIVLTTGVLASASSGRFSGRPIGIATMLFTAPQVAATSYLAATNPSSTRAGWIALSAWSGTLFVHGLVSTIRGHGSDAVPPEAAPPSPPGPDSRSPLLVPASLRLGPTVVSDGVATAVGIGVSGALY